MKLIKSKEHSRYLTAKWRGESLDIEIKYRGPSSGYHGAQLDSEVIPRIVECVNAFAKIADPIADQVIIPKTLLRELFEFCLLLTDDAGPNYEVLDGSLYAGATKEFTRTIVAAREVLAR
jgi:hypothetical protein